jgi:hypothetical protein
LGLAETIAACGFALAACKNYAYCYLQELDTQYRRIWDFGHHWDPDAYAAQSRGLPEIRRDLVMQRQWKGSLDRMKTNMTVGCLQVRT